VGPEVDDAVQAAGRAGVEAVLVAQEDAMEDVEVPRAAPQLEASAVPEPHVEALLAAAPLAEPEHLPGILDQPAQPQVVGQVLDAHALCRSPAPD
jgi:hypothetical protein